MSVSCASEADGGERTLVIGVFPDVGFGTNRMPEGQD